MIAAQHIKMTKRFPGGLDELGGATRRGKIYPRMFKPCAIGEHSS